MRLPRECYQMQQTIETHLPNLSQAQLAGLVLWVCGAILAGSACQNAVAAALSTKGNWNNLRQRLREWLYDGGDRASPCQTELDVSLCQFQRPQIVRSVAGQYLHGGDQLGIGVHHDRRLVPVEPPAAALVAVAHLRIMHRHHAVPAHPALEAYSVISALHVLNQSQGGMYI